MALLDSYYLDYTPLKPYAKPFENDGRRIYKIGINFSSKTRRIDGWKVSAEHDE